MVVNPGTPLFYSGLSARNGRGAPKSDAKMGG